MRVSTVILSVSETTEFKCQMQVNHGQNPTRNADHKNLTRKYVCTFPKNQAQCYTERIDYEQTIP